MNTTDLPQRKALEMDHLSIRFGAALAVEDVSFSVSAGETLAIVGESGSGKSVSSLAAMGLLPVKTAVVTNGKMRLEGKLVEDPAEYRGKAIAMIFQEPMSSLNPVMTCGEQVDEMFMYHEGLSRREARKKTIALFEEVKLPRPPEIADSFPHQVSGGQRQRVMIAMALSCHPSVLIADEPTTALDVTVQASILELLKSLQEKRGMAMVFISHDLAVVSGIADYIVVMKRGRVVESGKARDVLHSPQHPYTRGLLACRPAGKETMRRLPTIDDIEQGKPLNRERRELVNATGKTPLVRVEHLSKIFRGEKKWMGTPATEVRAVDDVSFEVYPGETLGLVGESGCGKSTLSRMLLGLTGSTSGSIFYGEKNLLSMSATELHAMRKRMQLIFQDPYSSLNPKLTVGASLGEPMQVFSMYGNAEGRRRKVYELLDRVGLPASSFDRYPHEFSGGQRQRIVIARALSMEPEFIVCDESVSALDVSVQAQVLNLLSGLKEEMGLTYIFISHDLQVIRHMSDRIMVMNKGKIEEIGPANQVLGSPRSDYTRQLLASLPALDG